MWPHSHMRMNTFEIGDICPEWRMRASICVRNAALSAQKYASVCADPMQWFHFIQDICEVIE
jgi:hypothetical protein